MEKLILFNNTKLNKLLTKRSGESKFGEHIKILSSPSHIYEQLQNLDVTHVVFGIPEDIGVFANHGKSGASEAWNATLKILLNIQSNNFTKANSVLILGHLDFTAELLEVSKLNQNKKSDIKKARKIVEHIDSHVTHIMQLIISSGKKAIVIGGGHNNAYGNIKGTSLALKKCVNAVNFDAHSDFRPQEGRHSGNGFSYAFAEGFLKNYYIFGLHENYTSNKILETLSETKHLDFSTFEYIEIKEKLSFNDAMYKALNHVSHKPFGIEIDCDAIANIPSSAMTPSGFTVNQTRQFVSYFANHKNATYLHICEAAPKKKTANQVGKLITYLITDFIKAHETSIT